MQAAIKKAAAAKAKQNTSQVSIVSNKSGKPARTGLMGPPKAMPKPFSIRKSPEITDNSASFGGAVAAANAAAAAAL